MLKTWKESVPGSIDTRPVFPPEVVRPIENALIKARTNALQAQQEHARGQQQILGRGRPTPQTIPHRDIPTPPASRPPQQANGVHYPNIPTTNGAPYGHTAQPPTATHPYHVRVSKSSSIAKSCLLTTSQSQPNSRSTPQPPIASTAFQPPQSGGYGTPQAGISIEALNGDILILIAASQAQLAQSPYDPSIQTRLKALMDLQTILQTQNLPPDQLVLVKNQIADLAVTIRAPPAQTSTPIPQPQPVAVAPPPPAPSAAPKVSLDSLFGSGSLAALMARNSTPQQVSTPQPPPATVAAIKSPTPQSVEPQKSSTPVPTDPMALLNALRKTGIIPAAQSSTPIPSATPSMPLPFPLPIPTRMPNVQLSPLETITSDISLNAASLKQYVPRM